MSDERTISNEVNIQEIVDITASKKNIILDATILSTIMNCGRLTDFRFNHNLQSISGKSNSLECGSIVHKFLEVFYGSIIKGVKRTDAVGFGMTAAELYIQGCKSCTNFVPIYCDSCKLNMLTECNECKRKPECGHKTDDYPGVKNTPKDSTTKPNCIGWSWVLETCQQYVDHYRNDHWVPLEVEIVKGKVLYEDDEIRILWKAKLDWIADTNQGIYPIEHKTMKQRRDTNSMNNQFIGQCLIMNTRSMFINKIGFQTTLKPEEKFQRTPMVNYSASRLLEWQSETLPYWAKILLMYAESGHFPPNFTNCEGKYGACAFLKVCESDPGMRESEIKRLFVVGRPWNPSNDNDE